MSTPNDKVLTEGGAWLAEALATGLRQSIEVMTSDSPALTWHPTTPEKAQEKEENWMWWQQPISASASSLLWVGAPEPGLSTVGKYALTAAGIDDATPEDCQGTWREIIGQALSSVAQAFGKRLRREVICENGKEAASWQVPDHSVTVGFPLDGQSISIRFGWNAAVQTLLDPQAPAAAQNAGAGAQHTDGGKGNLPGGSETSRTLDLLLEVELPVSVSFGRTQLPLKDVLKLNSGSIVELNRSIAEPVDLIVNNCVIARGEVVVVEGNYGVRIKQIVGREERLRTLY